MCQTFSLCRVFAVVVIISLRTHFAFPQGHSATIFYRLWSNEALPNIRLKYVSEFFFGFFIRIAVFCLFVCLPWIFFGKYVNIISSTSPSLPCKKWWHWGHSHLLAAITESNEVLAKGNANTFIALLSLVRGALSVAIAIHKWWFGGLHESVASYNEVFPEQMQWALPSDGSHRYFVFFFIQLWI